MKPFLDMNAAMLPLVAADDASEKAAAGLSATAKQSCHQHLESKCSISSHPPRVRQPLEEELLLLMKAMVFRDASDFSSKPDMPVPNLQEVSALLAAALFHAALQVLPITSLLSRCSSFAQFI
jgi:hypothetical protein